MSPWKRRVFETARCQNRRLFPAPGSLRLVPADNHTGYRPTILLAYHGSEVRQQLTALLPHRSYDVTSCDDGRTAAQLLAGSHFDLVITGILLPNMDGLELIRTLRRRYSPPPILAIAEDCNHMSQVYLRNATLFGATNTHTCPVDPTALLADVAWLLGGRTDVIREVVW